MNNNSNFDPARAPQAAGVQPVDLAGLLAALATAVQPQLQTYAPPVASAPGLPQMQMHAGTAPVPWPGQYWQQAVPHPQQASAVGPGMPPLQSVAQWLPQFRAPPQPPPEQNLQSVLAPLVSMLQTALQQQLPSTSQQQPQARAHAQSAAAPQARAPPAPGPVPFGKGNEARLVDALKIGRAQGITVRRVLETLDGVSDPARFGPVRFFDEDVIRFTAAASDANVSRSAWKDYFIDNLERFYPYARPQHAREPEQSSSSFGGSSSSRAERSSDAAADDEASVPKSQQPLALPRGARAFLVEKDNPPPATPRTADASAGTAPTERTVPPITTSQAETGQSRAAIDRPSAGPLGSGSHRTRGEPVAVFHAGTRIPSSSGRMKPMPPVLEDNDSEGARVGSAKFTCSEHIYFIHYLRWRLQDDPTITKQSLFRELAEQTPNHDAEAWRKHWENHPELPDQIYIELGQREGIPSDLRRQARSARARESSASESSLTPVDDTSDDEYDSDSGDEDSSAFSNRRRRATSSTLRQGRAITEEDIRAMARFRLERAEEWSTRTNKKRFWTEFALRPENAAKRSLDGWARAEKSRWKEFQLYYDEYEAQGLKESFQNKPSVSPTAAKATHREDPSGTPVTASNIEITEFSSEGKNALSGRGILAAPVPGLVPRKRKADGLADADGSGPSTHKRLKEGCNREVPIELSD
ncbi:hypothetical protein BV20DRAFT_1047850 [Pilatotrama ljubarskyi]|nr:hypothetical protein BV20DRAFT_1047850 [Pilatotrama ljubarskyi]